MNKLENTKLEILVWLRFLKHLAQIFLKFGFPISKISLKFRFSQRVSLSVSSENVVENKDLVF